MNIKNIIKFVINNESLFVNFQYIKKFDHKFDDILYIITYDDPAFIHIMHIHNIIVI